MLIKLIKYDLLADYKKYCTVFAAMLLLSIMMLMSENSSYSAFVFSESGSVIDIILFMSYTIVSVAAALMVVVFSISRFYTNLIQDEGYLMHTLPVPTWQLLASKLITTYIWATATVLMEIVCAALATGERRIFSDIISSITEITTNRDAAETMLYVLMSPFYLMSRIYLVCGLGNLFSKNKKGIAVVMYFVIQFIEGIFTTYVTMLVTLNVTAFSGYMFVKIVLALALSVGYFIAAERLFAKRLNLE